MKRIARACVFVGLAVLASGCATSRGVLDVRVPVPSNAASGTPVKVTRVTDRRIFELKPNKPSIPSLKDGEINNKAITSRAIARKRNTYGMALGDILLPEGQTVERLVKDALIRSFRESGYRVVDESDGAYGVATPIEADIDQFWGWVNPGFFTVDVDFDSRLRITGDVPGFRDSAEPVTGKARTSGMAAGSETWLKTTNEGIEALVKNIKQRLGAGGKPATP
jgi:hypothetical protein